MSATDLQRTDEERPLTRLPFGSPEYARCVDFLLDEVAALDENRLEDWLAMMHPEIDYRAPMRVTRERSKGDGFSNEGYHFFENHESLTTRVERLATDYAWAEDPPSRTRRFLSNFRVFAIDGSDDLRAESTCSSTARGSTRRASSGSSAGAKTTCAPGRRAEDRPAPRSARALDPDDPEPRHLPLGGIPCMSPSPT